MALHEVQQRPVPYFHLPAQPSSGYPKAPAALSPSQVRNFLFAKPVCFQVLLLKRMVRPCWTLMFDFLLDFVLCCDGNVSITRCLLFRRSRGRRMSRLLKFQLAQPSIIRLSRAHLLESELFLCGVNLLMTLFLMKLLMVLIWMLQMVPNHPR